MRQVITTPNIYGSQIVIAFVGQQIECQNSETFEIQFDIHPKRFP